MQNLIGAIQQQAVFAIEGAIASMFFESARQRLRSPRTLGRSDRTLASRDRVEGNRPFRIILSYKHLDEKTKQRAVQYLEF